MGKYKKKIKGTKLKLIFKSKLAYDSIFICLLRIQIILIYLNLYQYKILRKEIIFFLILYIGDKGIIIIDYLYKIIKSENNCLKNEK